MWESLRQKNYFRKEAERLFSGIQPDDDIAVNIEAEIHILYLHHVCKDLVGATQNDLLTIFGQQGLDYINRIVGKGGEAEPNKIMLNDNELVRKMRERLTK